MTMADEWKPKVGDVVWGRGVIVASDQGDSYLSHKVSYQGDELWMAPNDIRPDAPAPMEMDDVAVLRRAIKLMGDDGWAEEGGVCAALRVRADRIKAARRVPTPLEALKALDMMLTAREPGGPDAPRLQLDTAKAWAMARRAIAAAEKGEG